MNIYFSQQIMKMPKPLVLTTVKYNHPRSISISIGKSTTEVLEKWVTWYEESCLFVPLKI